MSSDRLSTSVWLLEGLFKSSPGTLKLSQGRLQLLCGEELIFDVSRDALSKVSFPKYYFGAGMVIAIESKSYRLSFVEPGENGDIVTGRSVGKSWQQRLLPGSRRK